MRNWNTKYLKREIDFIPGFYSTYEELKPYSFLFVFSWILSFLQYLWGIETIPVVFQAISKAIGFYSTYEELKHQEEIQL